MTIGVETWPIHFHQCVLYWMSRSRVKFTPHSNFKLQNCWWDASTDMCHTRKDGYEYGFPSRKSLQWLYVLFAYRMLAWGVIRSVIHSHQKSLATLDGEIVDPEIAVEIEMRDVLKVHDAHTEHLHHLIIKCNASFCKIGMRKYARKYFRWYCLLEELIHLNKGQIFITLVRP